MKVVMLSTDKNILDSKSQVYRRIIGYSELFDELHIVIHAPKNCRNVRSGKLFIWPACYRYKCFMPFSIYRSALRVIKTSPRDFVVSSQEEFTGLAAYFLKIRHGVMWQAQIHGDPLSSYFASVSYKNRIRRVIVRLFYRKADCIRVVSKRVLASLKNIGVDERRINVCPIWVDTRRFKLLGGKRVFSKTGGRFIFLMISRLTIEKNINLALDAFADIFNKYPKAELYIVGDGDQLSQLRKRTRELGIGRSVHFEGRREDITPYLRRAHCFLLTSWFEGYSMAVIEAMSSGLPVIMTDAGVAGELVVNGKSGIVVAPGDKDELASAMKRVISDNELAIRLGNEAQLAVESLPSPEEAKKLFVKTFTACGRTE